MASSTIERKQRGRSKLPMVFMPLTLDLVCANPRSSISTVSQSFDLEFLIQVVDKAYPKHNLSQRLALTKCIAKVLGLNLSISPMISHRTAVARLLDQKVEGLTEEEAQHMVLNFKTMMAHIDELEIFMPIFARTIKTIYANARCNGTHLFTPDQLA